MNIIFQTLLRAIIITIIWFIVGGVVYMNPLVAKIYKKYENHPAMKKWPSKGKYLLSTLLIAGFIPILGIIIIYNYISPLNTLYLGLLLIIIRVVPRLCDTWVQTSYPNKIIFIELINGSILSLIIAYTLNLNF
jgi:hypothetical protein